MAAAESDSVPVVRTPGRRTVRFDSPEAVLADVDRLRRGGYTQVGQWSLPQVCQHLATVIGGNLTPPANDDPPTSDQLAAKERFFGMVRGGLPEGLPAGQSAPPESCGDAAFDALNAAFASFAAYPHARLMVGRCGPVPVAEVRQVHLDHCAHHLSFLQPTTVRRDLHYRTLDDVVADVELLRKGNIRSANWTLEQACWHLRTVTELMMARPVTDPTPEMLARRPMLDGLLAGGPFPTGVQTTPELSPPAHVEPAEVDRFTDLVRRLQASPPRAAMHRLFGPVTGDEFQTIVRRHSAHHLGYLVPTTGAQ